MRERTPLAVEILDIDYFKQYNDHYGHQAGDDCIRHIADCIRDLMQESGIFGARYGGDEFILIYEGCTREKVLELALQLRESIINLRLEHSCSPAAEYVTISQGICLDVPREDGKIWDFLHTADGMLYQVKKLQRSNVSIGAFGEKERTIYGQEPKSDSFV